jgi:YegS/Rv2252/BmrU family lipid kinase
MGAKFCLVVNPAAGRGRGARLLPEVLGPLAVAGAQTRVVESSSLGHAATVAAQAADRGEAVVAVGGDGTVGRMAAAVAGAGGVLGIVPAGRGNDFARMLGIPARPAAAAGLLLAGIPQAVDLISAGTDDGAELVVAGSVYLGIPCDAAGIAQASRLATGSLGYQIAGLRALRAWRPATFSVDTGHGGPAACPLSCVVVANSAFFGAGIPAAPDASVTDGLLDVMTVRDGPKLSFLRVMLRAQRGTHLGLGQVDTVQAAAVTVTADRAMLAGADGEMLPFASPLPAGSPLRIKALPGALRVLAPGAVERDGQLSAGVTGRPRPPRKDSTKSGLAESSAGVPSILTSPPPST